MAFRTGTMPRPKTAAPQKVSVTSAATKTLFRQPIKHNPKAFPDNHPPIELQFIADHPHPPSPRETNSQSPRQQANRKHNRKQPIQTKEKNPPKRQPFYPPQPDSQTNKSSQLEDKKTGRQLLGLSGNALTISLTDLIGTAAIFLYQPFWSLYVLSLGASAIDLGIINLITALLGAALMPPMGYLSDRIGRKKPVVISGFIASIGPILQALAQNWHQLIPGVLVSSVLQIMWPIRQSIVADELTPENRIKGFATFFTIVMLPSAIMPLLSGYILDATGLDYGMRAMLVASGALGLLAALLRLIFIKEEKPKPKPTNREENTGIASFFKAIFEPIVKVKMLQVLILGSWGVMFVFGVMNSFAAVYATEYLSVSKTEWGLISSAAGLIGAFMRIPISKITLRLGEGNALAISQIGRSLYPILFVHIRGTYGILALTAAYNFAFNLGSPAYQAMITEYTPAHQRGRAYGVFGMMWGTLAQLSSLFGGVIWDTQGPPWAFYSAGIVAYGSTAFLCGWLFLQHKKRAVPGSHK